MSAGAFPAASTISNQNAPIRVRQGDVFYFAVQVAAQNASVQGRFQNRLFPFFETETAGKFGALIGVDLADPPSRKNLVVEISTRDGRTEQRRYPVEIVPSHFPMQELEVPQNFVELDEETLKRTEEEQEKILQSLSRVNDQRYWEGRFVMPVEGKIAGSFGRRRIMNGQPRAPHSGEDITAPKGTDVHATNGGVVALVGDFFFSGKSVILDHGLGLYSMYFHLDDVAVSEGEEVHKGDVVGKVGATGRATGPHLHWGARLNGARVNPLSILKVE